MTESQTPLQDAIDRTGALPENEVTITGVHEQGGESGVSIDAQKDIGKPGGWTAAASAAWWKRAGYRVAGVLKWRPKP